MDRVQKQAWVEEAHTSFLNAEILLITHYQGLTVEEVTGLRVKVREAGASFKVVKNRLAKLALKDTSYGDLSDLFKGPVAVAYSDDPVAAAKVIADFAKDNEKLVMIGGAFGETVLDVAEIQKLAKMPSLDELRAKIIALLNTPATRIAGVTQAPAGQLARVFGAYGSSEEAA